MNLGTQGGRRLYFNPDKKSWHIASTSEQTAIKSDVESLDSSLASEDHDGSDGDSSMFEKRLSKQAKCQALP